MQTPTLVRWTAMPRAAATVVLRAMRKQRTPPPPKSPESHCDQNDDSPGPLPYQFEPLDPHVHTGEREDEPDEASVLPLPIRRLRSLRRAPTHRGAPSLLLKKEKRFILYTVYCVY